MSPVFGFVLLSKIDNITIAGDFTTLCTYAAHLFNSREEAACHLNKRKDKDNYEIIKVRIEHYYMGEVSR